MAGKSKGPWVWKQRQRWCVVIRGKRVELDAHIDDEAGARREWHRLMAVGTATGPASSSSSMTAKHLLGLHDDYAKENLEDLTYLWYVGHSKSFSAMHGNVPAEDVRPHHVDSWLASHQWARNTQRGAINAIKIAFAWAKKRGHIESNPLADVEKPKKSRRKAIISAEQVAAFGEEMKDGPFRDLFMVVMITGCRPSEACKVETKHFDPKSATWTLHGKTTNATGKLRVVYLPDAALEICKRLASRHRDGPLFRNAYGKPWNRHAYGHRVRRMRAKLKLGREVTMSSLRHLWITNALEDGIPIATVAELAGHSGVAMVSEAYSMLHQRTDHLREAANMINSRGRTSRGDDEGQGGA